MIKEFQKLRKHLVQSLKEEQKSKQLLQNTTNEFELEKVEWLKSTVKGLSVLEKQVALAKRIPNTDDRAVKLLFEVYENHRLYIEETLRNAGVQVHENNLLATSNIKTTIDSASTNIDFVPRQYFYKNISLNMDD